MNSKKNLSFVTGLMILGVIYVLLALGYLIQFHGLPYVFDNNESFSSIIHAKNLLQFDFFKSYGLTDESVGAVASAHPYVYTHQGNFPRIFAALLYFLGFKSIQSQILVHLVVVNSLALYLAYAFFAKKINPLFALMYCLLLLTDYVMHFQWQFNTWRVWHCFFMFSSLSLVEQYQQIRRRYYLPLALLNFTCLAYYEISYAIFINSLCVLLAIFKYKKPKLWAPPVVMVFLGAAIGFGALILQDFLYFGSLSGFLADLNFTFTARNKVTADPLASANFMSQTWKFVETWNLVFWGNFVSSTENLRSLVVGIKMFAHYNLMQYTPLFILILISLYFAFFLAFSRRWILAKQIYLISSSAYLSGPDRTNAYKSIVILMFVIFSLIVLFQANLITHLDFSPFSLLKSNFLFFIILVLLAWNWLLPKWGVNRPELISAQTVGATFFYLIILGLYSLGHDRIFRLNEYLHASNHEELWLKLITANILPLKTASLIYLLAVLVGIFIVNSNPWYSLPKKTKLLWRLKPLILAGILAGIVVWSMMSGYLKSGYLTRYVPFFEYFTVLFLVIPMYLVVELVGQSLQRMRGQFEASNNSYLKTLPSAIELIPLYVVCSFMVLSWGTVQLHYFNTFKTSQFALFETLALPVFQGKSIVANTYSIPFSVQTNQWSFFDPDFAEGRIDRTQNGYAYSINDKYLWLADRKTNVQYRTPDYFVCLMPVHFNIVSGFVQRCDRDVPLIANLERARKESSKSDRSGAHLFRHELMAISSDPEPRWAIVKLDYDFPPYLLPSQNQRYIGLTASGGVIEVDYQYRHQSEKREEAPIIELYQLSSCLDKTHGKFVRSVESKRVPINSLESGIFQFSVVPRTATKEGETYWSPPVRLSSGSLTQCPKGASPTPPLDVILKPSADGRAVILQWKSENGLRHFEIQESLDLKKFTPVQFIDGEKRNVQITSILESKKHHLRIRGCSDWACSAWSSPKP